MAHALLGDDVAFSSAITVARRELDRGLHETDPAWAQFVSHSEINGYEAMATAQLDVPTRAARLYQIALDDTTRSPRDRAMGRALLAETLVTVGDLDQAIHHGLMILPELGTTLTSGRVLQRLRPVREAAGGPTGAEFCERFDAAARALRSA